MRKSKFAWIISLFVGLFILSGCSNMETQPDQQGIRYEGGFIFPQAVTFKNCQGPGRQEFGDAGDRTFSYPGGQRTFKFSVDPGSDAPPLISSAPSPNGGQPINLTVSGTVTFTPNFSDCDSLRRFHETIGLKYEAWNPTGWNQVLSVYIKDPVDRAIDSAALGFDWVRLSSSAVDKDAWESAVARTLPDLIERQAGGGFFTVNSVILQRPELPVQIQEAIAQTERARQEAATVAQVQQAAASFPGGIEAYQQYLNQQAVNEAIRSGQVQVLPIPQGSPIIVQPNPVTPGG